MDTNGQILLYQSTAARTHFGSIAWINLHEVATSIFRFVRNKLYKLSPGNIRNASVHAAPVAVHHFLNFQLFKCDYAESVHQLAAEFMRKVPPFISDALMYVGQYLSPLGSFRCALLSFAQSSLRSCKSLFLFTEEARVRNLLAIGICGKIRETNINADHCIDLRKRLSLDLARKAGIPISDSVPPDGQILYRSGNRSVKFDLHFPDLGQTKIAIIQKIEATLGIGETVITGSSSESWITRFLTSLYTTEESLECKIDTSTCFLQRLRISIDKKGVIPFPGREHPDRVITRQRLLFLFPRVFTSGENLIVNPSASIERLLESESLCFCRIDSILVGSFMHKMIMPDSSINSNSSPPHTVLVSLEAVGFSC